MIFNNINRGSTIVRLVTATGVLLALAACEQQQTELQSWMDSERKAVSPQIAKIEEPKKFEPYRYENAGALDPFSQAKLSKALEAAASRSKSGLQPDLARRRESLEEFPVDSIKMVGHITRQGQNFGLVTVDSAVYPVKIGNYIGQNFGKIVKISETEISLKELIQDATGDWVERQSALQLQEVKKN